MANFDSLVIDRVLEIVGENSDGDLLYLMFLLIQLLKVKIKQMLLVY